MIKKRILMTLTMMTVLLSLAVAPALAESQLDQSYELHNGSFGIGAAGLFEAVKVGRTGTLDKVELLVACCGGPGTPTRDLKVTVSSSGVSEVAWIPKEQFPEDNEQNFKWVTATLDTPLPVQDTKGLKIHLTDPGYNDVGPQSSQYLWAATSSSTYSQGALYWCYMAGLSTNLQLYCEPIEPTSDADFRTYVTPGSDIAPPITNLPPDDGSISNPNGPRQGSTTNSTNASFTFSADEAGSTFECKLDDNAWQSCASPKGYTGLSDGSHTFQVRAVDPSGNADPTPESRQWFVDTTPPDTTITSGPSPGTVSGRQVKFEFTSSESGSTFMCRYSESVTGSSSWTSCGGSFFVSFLFDGSYTFEVYAIDRVGNADPEPASRTWTVDATAPAVPGITSPDNNSFDPDGNVTVSGIGEPGSTVELFEGSTSKGTAQVDSSGHWSLTLSGVAEGSHTYTARAKDAVGNMSAESNSRTVIVDATAPSAPVINSPANNSIDIDGNITLSGTAEEGSKVEVFDGTTSKGTTPVDSSGAWSMTLSAVGEGAHTYTAKATDAANNTSGPSNPTRVKVDTTPPKVTSTSPASGATGVSPTANVKAAFSEQMRASTIKGTTFELFKKGSTTKVGASVSYDSGTHGATLDPTNPLNRGATYRAVVMNEAKDLAGNGLDQNSTLSGLQQKTWSFTIHT